MSSNSGGSHSGGENEDIEADVSKRNKHGRSASDGKSVEYGDALEEQEQDELAEEAALPAEDIEEQEELPGEEQSLEEDYPQASREQTSTPDDLVPDDGPTTPTGKAPVVSPADSGSIPDDTPRCKAPCCLRLEEYLLLNREILSDGRHLVLYSLFERRFEARPSVSRSTSSRTDSPAFLSPHSRQISLSSQISQISSQEGSAEAETPQAPNVVKWTKLRKITGQAFSEAGKRNFGSPTCLAVSALIAIGTSKGLVLGFDYH